MSVTNRDAYHSALRFAVAFLGYLAFTVVLTYPLLFRMTDHVLVIPVDNLHLTWILAWDYHALGSDPRNLFTANIFHPAGNTLALSEHLLGNLPIFAPVMYVSQNPVLAANAVVFASFVLSGLAMFGLTWYWTRSFWPSFIAGFIYAFALPRFGQLGKWHLLSVQWAPLAVLFADRFLRSRRWRDALAASGLYVLQVLSSYYLGYALTFVLGGYLGYALLTDRSLRTREVVAKLAVCLALALAVIVPLSYPYFLVKHESNLLVASPQALGSVSTDPALSFLSVSTYGNNIYQRALQRFQSSAAPWESWLFPGIVPVLLALLPLGVLSAGAGLEEAARRWDHRTVRALLLVVVVSLVMSLGPYLILKEKATGIPMPYLLFYDLVPGFSSLRFPARFAMLAWLGGSALAGFGVQLLLEAVERRVPAGSAASRFRRAGLCGLLLALLAVESWFPPLPMDPIETGRRIPPVYRWLAGQPRDGAVLEVPWAIEPSRNMDPAWQARYVFFSQGMALTQGSINLLDWITRSRYVYFSVYHWQPLVNGYSSHTPPAYERIVQRLRGLPDRESVEYLGSLGVRWIVVHAELLAPEDAQRWQSVNPRAIGLEKAGAFGPDVVYQVMPR